MNTYKRPELTKYLPVAECAILALVLGWLTGCASPGYKKSDAAAQSMSSAAAEVQAESVALQVARSSLNGLVDSPQADLKVPFARYSEALDRLVSCARRTESTGQTMARKSQAYFATWDRQLTNINYQVIRDTSSTRRDEARMLFEGVNRRYQDTQAVVWPLIAYLEDIRRALSADLTEAGVASAKPVVAHANQNMDKLDMALAALASTLQDTHNRFSSVAAPAAQPNDQPSPNQQGASN